MRPGPMIVLLAVAGITLSTSVLVAQENVTLQGEILDMACYLAKEKKGPDHKSCAQLCAKSGKPIGILTDAGDVFLLIDDHDDEEPYDAAKKLAGTRAEITGQKFSKGGVASVLVTGAKGLYAPSTDSSSIARLQLRFAPHTCAIVVATLLAVGCAGNGPPSAGDGGAFATIQQEIFNPSCISGGCHNEVSRAGDLVLVEGVSYQQLVNQPAVNAGAQARGLDRVLPFNPTESFLLIKVTHPGPAEGTRMPQGAEPLSDQQIELIRGWIVAGAPEGAVETTTPLRSPSATATPTVIASVTPTPSPLPTHSTTPSPTGTLAGTPTPTATATASTTPSATASPTMDSLATLANIQATIFNPTCIDQFCHSSQTQAGNLVLEDGVSYDQLVGVLSSNLSAKTAGLLRVQPFDPDTSFLAIKVENPTIPQGSRMPLGKPALSAEQIGLIRTWIVQGAQP